MAPPADMPVMFAGFTATSAESDFSRPFIVGYGSSPSRRDPATQASRMGKRSPGSRTKSFRTCQGLRPRRAVGTLALSRSAMSPSAGLRRRRRDNMTFAAQWLAYPLPCRRFACALASANARLGADVDRYSFIASDLHRLLLAGLPAHNPLGSTRKSAQIDDFAPIRLAMRRTIACGPVPGACSKFARRACSSALICSHPG